MTATQKLVIGDVIQEMRDGFDRHRPLILRITIGFAVLNALSGLLDIAGAAGTALTAGIVLLLTAAYGGMITALLCLPRPKPVESAGELWSEVTPVLARLIWVTLITIAAVLAGLLVLIIPGLILLTVFAVTTQVVVVERTGAFASLGRSVELVKGNGLRVFGFMLLVGLICLLLISLSLVVVFPVFGNGVAGTVVSNFVQNLVVAPILAIGPAALYNRLTRNGTSPEPGIAGQDL